MSTVLSYPQHLAERLSRDFFVHSTDSDESVWLQSGGVYPDEQPILFLVSVLPKARILVDDRGVTARFYAPWMLEQGRMLAKIDRLLALHGAFRDPSDQSFCAITRTPKVADAVHRLRGAVERILSEFPPDRYAT